MDRIKVGRSGPGRPRTRPDRVAAVCQAKTTVPTVTGFGVLCSQRHGEALQAARAAEAHVQGRFVDLLSFRRVIDVHVHAPACDVGRVWVLRRLDQFAKLLFSAGKEVQAVHRVLQLGTMSGPG